MTVHLVTGHAGKIHVTSAEQGAFWAALFGAGVYAVNGCELSIVDQTTVHIAEGTLLVQGRHVNINDGGDDVTVPLGVIGEKRRDLICLKYAMNEQDGIESCELVNVQGASGTDYVTPVLEEQNILNGDNPVLVPLYSVDINETLQIEGQNELYEAFVPTFDLDVKLKETYDQYSAQIKDSEGVLKAYIDQELGLVENGNY